MLPQWIFLLNNLCFNPNPHKWSQEGTTKHYQGQGSQTCSCLQQMFQKYKPPQSFHHSSEEWESIWLLLVHLHVLGNFGLPLLPIFSQRVKTYKKSALALCQANHCIQQCQTQCQNYWEKYTVNQQSHILHDAVIASITYYILHSKMKQSPIHVHPPEGPILQVISHQAGDPCTASGSGMTTLQ